MNQQILNEIKRHQAGEPSASCDSPCPVAFAMSLIGGKWKCIVLHNLMEEPMRFGVLRRAIPDITQRMLTLTLRELEADEIVNRKVFEVVPPHVEYSLTPLGRELKPVMDALSGWSTRYYLERYDDNSGVEPVQST